MAILIVMCEGVGYSISLFSVWISFSLGFRAYFDPGVFRILSSGRRRGGGLCGSYLILLYRNVRLRCCVSGCSLANLFLQIFGHTSGVSTVT